MQPRPAKRNELLKSKFLVIFYFQQIIVLNLYVFISVWYKLPLWNVHAWSLMWFITAFVDLRKWDSIIVEICFTDFWDYCTFSYTGTDNLNFSVYVFSSTSRNILDLFNNTALNPNLHPVNAPLAVTASDVNFCKFSAKLKLCANTNVCSNV